VAKWRERECVACGEVLLTASKSDTCISCCTKNKRDDRVTVEKRIIEDYGYQVVGEPEVNKYNKRVYRLVAPCCGNEWPTVFGNLLTGIKRNEQSGYEQLPCGTCGPKNRMATALKAYEDKHGKDYDEIAYNSYKQKVRSLSNKIYQDKVEILNPEGHQRGLAGEVGAYHLDHKVSIMECFKRGWTIEQASDISNLQMLKWEENILKGHKNIMQLE